MKLTLKGSNTINFYSILLFLPFILFGTFLFAQNEIITYNIKWNKSLSQEINEELLQIPNCDDCSFTGFVPKFSVLDSVNSNLRYELSFLDYQTVPASSGDIAYLSKQKIQVPQQADYILSTTFSAKEQFRFLELFPFVKSGDQVRRISSVSIEQKILGKIPKTFATKDFAAGSVLNSGEWFRIKLSQTGIFKIDRALLISCGIDPDAVNPMSIHVFGNADGRLPELNSAPRTDDLAQNAVQYVGLGDGVFDDEDYILFQGWSPHRWYETANGFTQDRNIYSDLNYYFINVDASRPAMQIQLLPDPVAASNTFSSSYSYYDVHENDLINLVKGGQRWYGELFDTELNRTFTFSVPNIVPGAPSHFVYSLASNGGGASNTHSAYLNGTLLETNNLPGFSDYGRGVYDMLFNASSSTLNFQLTVQRNSPDVLTYLDEIELNTRRNLVMNGSTLYFRDKNAVGAGNIVEYSISNVPAGSVLWDITDRQHPYLLNYNIGGSNMTFSAAADSLREFVISDMQSFLSPVFVNKVENQNLHAMSQCDYLIVTHPLFIAQANRLADLHRAEGLIVNVATTQQIFNEFSSGANDPTAIRTFARMFYKRGLTLPGPQISSLLLFGDGTYDPKNRVGNNNYFVPCYEALSSENLINAIASDDYFAMLDESDSFHPTNLQDIGVGRLLISDNQMAKEQVDKIEHYIKNGSSLFVNQDAGTMGNTSNFGDWRLKYVQVADDEQNGLFITSDTEPQVAIVENTHPEMNAKKLYLDAYQQTTSAGGHRYPDVYDAITRNVERGALVINYSGHGGEVGVAEERVITIPQILDWKNANNFPLFVTSTCEFTRYDDPSRVSAGEWVSLNPVGGAIALMTTTRPVYVNQNTISGTSFFNTVFLRDLQNEPLTFGEIARRTKNNSGTSENRRVFTLIGDPALKIALPRLEVKLDSVNGMAVNVQTDTIMALSHVTMSGHVEDNLGNILTNFNGVVSPSIYDKKKTVSTLAQDPASPLINFKVQENIIYRGKATVTNGYFTFSFIVPKDINYQYGHGKVSLYAESAATDAGGSDTNIVVGGIDPNGIVDNLGPEIELYLNDESFVTGGITDETPILLANLFDDHGINTVGNGVGHDITAIIDAESADPIILNDFYTADLDSYQSGKVRFKLSELEQGKHTLTLKVWDVNNNSAEKTIEFTVQAREELALDHVLNYPNPFTTRTEFYFEHNQVASALETQIEIFTVSGRLVKTINELVETQGFRSNGIVWDGRDEFGDQLAKGVYIYRLKVKTPEGNTDEKIEKLVLLK